MAEIVLTTFLYTDYQGRATSFCVEIYANKDWTDAAGVGHVGGAPDFGPFYKKVNCTKSGTTIAVPQITLQTTNDALENADVRITAVLRAGREIIAYLLKDGIIPVSLAASGASWAALRVYDKATVPPPSARWLSAEDTIELIKSVVALSVVSLDSLADVSINDPQEKDIVKRINGLWVNVPDTAAGGDTIYIESYGAVDDDATSGTTALQAAVDAAAQVDGGVIEGMNGIVRVTSPGITKNFFGTEGDLIFRGGKYRLMNGVAQHFNIGNTNQLKFDGVTFLGILPQAFTSIATNVPLYLLAVIQTTFEHCAFFGIYSTGTRGGVIFASSHLSLKQCFFGGCGSGAGKGVVHQENGKGLHLEDVYFLDYGNFSGVYYAQGAAGAWVLAKGAAGVDSASLRRASLKRCRFDEGARSVHLEDFDNVEMEGCRANWSAGGVYYFKNCKRVHIRQSSTHSLGGGGKAIFTFENCGTVILDQCEGTNGCEYIEVLGTTEAVILRDCNFPGNATYPDGIYNPAGARIYNYDNFGGRGSNYAKTGSYSLTASDSGNTFTNTGATSTVAFNLPPIAEGLEYTFVVNDADGLRVTPQGGAVIRDGANSTEFYMQSAAVGATLVLRAVAGAWVVLAKSGSWTYGSAAPVLDAISSSVYGAYGVTRMRAAYAGPCLRVRDSLGAESDIGFDANGLLNTAALSGNAPYDVIKWYDQTGNGNDIAEVQAGHAPYLDVAGVSVRFEYEAADHFLGLSVGDLSALAAGEMFVKSKRDTNIVTEGAGGNGLVWLFGTANGTEYYGQYPPAADLTRFYDDFGSNARKDYLHGTDLTEYHIYSAYSAPGDWAAYINNQLKHSTVSNTVAFPSMAVFGRVAAGGGMIGNVKALIICSAKASGIDRSYIHTAL